VKKHLLLVGSPNPESSEFLTEFIEHFHADHRFEVRLLTEHATSFTFNAIEEQQIIDSAESIILHFPIHWYSMPALLKVWLDTTLTYGWAFDANGGLLDQKPLMCSLTTGAPLSSYQTGEKNKRSLDTYLLHLERTVEYVGFNYLGSIATDQVRKEVAKKSARDQKRGICERLGISATAEID
jgi:putative NADPH-quinone reductase